MQQGSDAAAAAAAQQQHRRQFLGLTAYDRHKRLIAEYVNFYGGKLPAPAEQPTLKTDYDILREQYRYAITFLCSCHQSCQARASVPAMTSAL